MREVEPMSDEGVEHVRRVVDAAYAAGNPSPYDVQTAMLLKRIDAIQSDRDELHGRLLESSKRLLEIKAERDALQAVVDKLPKDGNGNPVRVGMAYYTADGHGFNLGVDALGQIIDHMNNEVNEPVFPTRAAAEAARKERQDGD